MSYVLSLLNSQVNLVLNGEPMKNIMIFTVTQKVIYIDRSFLSVRLEHL
jgi:hypothetical protein